MPLIHTVLRSSLVALITVAAPAQAGDAATKPLPLQRNDFPTLATNEQIQRLVIFNPDVEDFPQRCEQLRMVKLAELSPRWQPVIDRLTLKSCEVTTFDDGETYLSYEAQATFKPAATTLQGLPVIGYHEGMGERHIRQSLVVDAPITQLLNVLRPVIERDCQPMLQLNPMAVRTCTMAYDGEAWSMIVGELNHTVWLRADPDSPARSMYEVSGGD
ncbi:hypothetical protein [Stenotrophomonas sp. Iso1]|uniref:hypothetical protein n=1 Tax=Stenotrophomonas sp. Iso1 TaxID=2977283 RepID=UPI0022B77946|nr:hypothetical protein [Stenotrophomonas sp. Iso1]